MRALEASARVRYHEIRFWSVTLGRHASRIFVFDAHGDEHFAIVPMDGRSGQNRETRARTLEAIAEHVLACEPGGEVEVELEAQSN